MGFGQKMSNRQHLYSAYQRIKKNCCKEWLTNSKAFYSWYENRAKEQEELCEYCDLPGDTEKYYHTRFRKDKKGRDRRGHNLEVDRKDNNQPYSPENCVLACYPCNNAKSDVFSYEEFLKIGETIGKVKQRTRYRL
jgi:5-methylcytosine-specific restriction endonuclease McrA